MPLLLLADAGPNSWTRRVTSASRHHVRCLEGRMLDIIRSSQKARSFLSAKSVNDWLNLPPTPLPLHYLHTPLKFKIRVRRRRRYGLRVQHQLLHLLAATRLSLTCITAEVSSAAAHVIVTFLSSHAMVLLRETPLHLISPAPIPPSASRLTGSLTTESWGPSARFWRSSSSSLS